MTLNEPALVTPAEDLLAQADPLSLELLMKKDPLKLTKVDRVFIIAELRKGRVQWSEIEKVKKSPAAKEAKTKKKEDAKSLLSSLGLNII